MIDKQKAEGCGFCGGEGVANSHSPRPCPKCQRQCYAPAPDPEPAGWCAGRVYCFVCEHIAVYVWPWGADERRLQCAGCRQLDTLVVTRILTKEMTVNLLRALRND